MIRSFEVKDPNGTHIEWWPKVDALSKPRKFEFKPGLNILWGKNGSGKSTVLKAMARLLHCEQGGSPMVTQASMDEVFGSRNRAKEKNYEASMVLDHDGQPTRHFDPSVAVGLIGGMAGFDYDFIGMGTANAMFKGSAGQTTMFRCDELMRDLIEERIPEIQWKVKQWTDDDERFRIVKHFLKGSGEKGPITVLMDEPERSYDLPTQVAIWRFIRSLSSKVQFIVASHSFYALRLPEAHYIQMDETYDYLARSLQCLTILGSWRDEKPVLIPKPIPISKSKKKKGSKP